MKLLLCPKCGDIFNLNMTMKICSCGNTKGRYNDNINAIHIGDGIPLCISNPSIREAIMFQKHKDVKYPDEFYGEKIDSWVCPANSTTFKRRS